MFRVKKEDGKNKVIGIKPQTTCRTRKTAFIIFILIKFLFAATPSLIVMPSISNTGQDKEEESREELVRWNNDYIKSLENGLMWAIRVIATLIMIIEVMVINGFN
jgi:hypothetical protein